MTAGFRLRVCFRKSGRLRWLSHLEVLHALERTVRRSGLEYSVTQGFSPHMKLAFGPALPVGTAGEKEYADIWLKRYTAPEDAFVRLSSAAPDGLAPVSVAYVADKEPSLTAALTIGEYRVEVDRKEIQPAEAQSAIDALLQSGRLEIGHKGKTKVFDLTRSVPKDVRVEVGDEGLVFLLAVRMGPHGSLRPDALVRASLAAVVAHDVAVRTTRLDLFVEDDEGVWSRPM